MRTIKLTLTDEEMEALSIEAKLEGCYDPRSSDMPWRDSGDAKKSVQIAAPNEM